MNDARTSVREFLELHPYAYLTVYGRRGVLCEGTVRSLSRIADLAAFEYRSFFAMSNEDGGYEAEATVAM